MRKFLGKLSKRVQGKGKKIVKRNVSKITKKFEANGAYIEKILNISEKILSELRENVSKFETFYRKIETIF